MKIHLYTHGKFYIGPGAFAEALAVANGTILAAGSNHDLIGAFPLAQKINLGGKTVLPAFTDAHTHFAMYCLNQSKVNLNGLASKSECLHRIRQKVETTPKGQWITGGGWNQNLWSGAQYPDRHELDALTQEHPICLDARDYHSVWVNSLALQKCGVHSGTVFDNGGRIEKDVSGEPTGILKEEARRLIWDKMEEPDVAERMEAVRRYQHLAFQNGLAGVHCMETLDDFRAYQTLHHNDELKLRVTFYLPIRYLEHVIESGMRSGLGDDRFRFAGMKIFMDGTLGSQTALMIEPFENSDNPGTELTSQDDVHAYVLKAAQHDIACAVHAIGDRANRNVLNAFELYRHRFPEKTLRQRVEHAQLIHPDDISRFAELGVIASMQAIHIPEDIDAADRFWGKRARWAYPFRSLLNSRASLAMGSDVPIETCNVFEGIDAALRRTKRGDSTAWYPEERMKLDEIIHAYTMGAAYASGEETFKGSLTPGKAADFMVVSDDIFKMAPERICELKVETMVIGGEIVYER